jgi:alanyl-tRNA synthetase
VSIGMMTVEQAKAEGATALFTGKYGEQVKVYAMGDFSKEVCGGPHVQNTGELGRFKILKEEASSAGVRRIRAVLEPVAG